MTPPAPEKFENPNAYKKPCGCVYNSLYPNAEHPNWDGFISHRECTQGHKPPLRKRT